METYTKLSSKTVANGKQRIRGGDYLELLAWYTSKRLGKGGNKYRDAEVIRSMIFAGIDHQELSKKPMFKKLLPIT